MANKLEMDTTTNRSVFNKCYKEYHAFCSYCPWHGYRSENDRWTSYGGWETESERSKFPSWKLVSKNRKQWMKKPIKRIEKTHRYWRITDIWIDIRW